jgi:hypothetical protein
MKWTQAIGVVVVAFVTCLIASSQTVIPQTDTQNWNDVFLSVPLTKRVDFAMQGTIRNGRDLTRPVDERLGIGFSFKFGKYITVIPNYLYIGMQPFRGRRVFEQRLSLPATIRFNVGKFTFADRNLFERRFRRPGINATRYRNRLQIDHPVGPAKHKLSLFVSEEVFYDWSFDAWVRNRFCDWSDEGFEQALHGRFVLHATERRSQLSW